MLHLGGLFGIGSCPSSLGCITFSYDGLQFFRTVGIEFGNVRIDGEGIFRITTQILDGLADGGSGSRQWLTVCVHAVFVAALVFAPGTFTHQGVTDDQGRTVVDSLCLLQCLTDLGYIITIDLEYLPAPCFVFHGDVFSIHLFHFRRKLDVVGVVEHNQIVQA